MENQKTNNYNFIDLFAGAGGLSEGFIQAGFLPLAHVEMNPYAAMTLETRSAWYYLKSIGDEKAYYDYLLGKMTRKELFARIPEECLQTVICETMSDKTLPTLFKRIDGILNNKGICLSITRHLLFLKNRTLFWGNNHHF